MITFQNFSYAYPDATHPVLQNLSLHISAGEFVLVAGPSGTGKSTFLRTINGLVPHFYGGTVSGRVEIGGLNPIEQAPRGMAHLVGYVFQDPEASFVMDTVEDEIAFAMENFALLQSTMRKRIEEVLDQLNIAHLRARHIGTLSGGEKQRVALAAALALQPRILVLDEPTSQLDPQAAEEVLIALRQLNEDLGLTVVCAEHRLERVVQYVDRILYFSRLGEAPLYGAPQEVLPKVELTPPLVTLGKALGWHPLPLTIKEGRRTLERLGYHGDEIGPQISTAEIEYATNSHVRNGCDKPPETIRRDVLVAVERLWHAYDSQETLRDVNLKVYSGELVAVMGRNGSGKTTLLKHLAGLLKPQSGVVRIVGVDTQDGLEAIVPHVGYVPQHPGALLFTDSIYQELAFTRRVRGLPHNPDANNQLLQSLGIEPLAETYPRDLSGGETQRAALAAVLAGEPQVLLLDEPTRGLDYHAKASLMQILRAQCKAGHAVILVTHDVEMVAACADRVVLLAEGQVVVDGSVQETMTESLVFTTQIHKLFRDPRLLTVEDALKVLQPTLGDHE